MSRGGKGYSMNQTGEIVFVQTSGQKGTEDRRGKGLEHKTLLGNKELDPGCEHNMKCPIFPVAITAPWKRPRPPRTLLRELLPQWPHCQAQGGRRRISSIMKSSLNYKLADLGPSSGSSTNGVRNSKQVSPSISISYFYP